MIDAELLRDFFMWCTIINVAILLISFLFLSFSGNFVYKMHGSWFPMSREEFTTSIYRLLGIMKILVIIFNAVPYIALLILT